MGKKLSLVCLVTSLLLVVMCNAIAEEPKENAPYVPTPEVVVDGMLKMASVTADDVVYDLGCGDGRIVIAAAKQYGARGKGFDIDPQLIAQCNENAKKAGVADKAEFVVQDLFTADLSGATVVTLYLLPSVNERLRPKLLEVLKPGTRVVSHAFGMGNWRPDQTQQIEGRTVHFWVIPAHAEGRWKVDLAHGGVATLDLKQKYQHITGQAELGGSKYPIQQGRIIGDTLTFSLAGDSAPQQTYVVQLEKARENQIVEARVVEPQPQAQPAAAILK